MIVTTDMTAKEMMNDFKETYAKVRKLLDDDAPNDPTNEPYLSKYKAKDILNKMREALMITKGSERNWDNVKIDAMLGVVLLNIGIIDMETDDASASEKVLTEAETLLLPHSSKPEVVSTLINIENHLGLLWSNRDEPEKGKSFLLKAKEFYESFKCTMQMPISIENIIHVSDRITSDIMLLEKPYTLTLYYLAQVYGSLKENLKSAIYCHVTLRRQLQYNDYDPIDWSLNSATLSQFFAERNGFFQSRHHLAAASTILDQYEARLLADETNDEVLMAKKEQFNHRSADVARCWAKYCIILMTASKNRLMSDPDNLDEAITDLTNLQLEDNENICGGDIKNLVFPDLDVSKHEKKIGHKFLLTYQDAREVFLNCQTWLNKAKEYYTPDTLASDYIQLVQDNSEAYSFLAFFEEDDGRRAKMQKRRIDIIEDLLKEINPTYYLHYCQQLWHELGVIYSEILDIKLDSVKKNEGKPTPHLLKKINMLCEKSIENYERFIESFKDKNGILPLRMEEEFVRPLVCAYAFIGRNSMKRIALDKQTQLSHVKKSYESYQAVVDICSNDKNSAKMMSVEYSLCQEMVKILPIKIKKLEAEMVTLK
ncbi:unnamed protein product [Pieris brassicae]|uniref:KIF-binding protein n=1 Tax=Pieris brassicae TaxID=7116 RepID=A0A9P0WXF5_PIEBR|nr:unnamed protein product [Pieris brassicae]